MAFLGFFALYQMSLKGRKAELVELARAQARMIEASGKFDAFFHSDTSPGASRSATLSQIRESHRQYRGFGETGELVLVERRGDVMWWHPLHNHRACP